MKVLTITICSLFLISSHRPTNVKVYSKRYFESGKRLILFPNNEFNLRSYALGGVIERSGTYENIYDTLRLLVNQQSCGLFYEMVCDTNYTLNYLSKDEELLFEILNGEPNAYLRKALGDSLFKEMMEQPPVLWKEF